MAQKNVTLQPGESRAVSFEVIPSFAKTYSVSVDGLSGSFKATAAPPFDPWVYDLNKDGNINNAEALKATDDYYAGIITKDQVFQVLALPSPPPTCSIGATKCVGYDLYECRQVYRETQWVLVEKNSTVCGYVPPQCIPYSEKLKAIEAYYDDLITRAQLDAILAIPTCP